MEKLQTVFSVANEGSATDGVSVTAYGQGQCSGATYTVSAHSTIDVDFTIHQLCITPDNVNELNNLIRGLLDATKQHEYDELSKTESSGGMSFFWFLSSGGGTSSSSQTKHTMDSWGLTRDQQSKIIDTMMALTAKTNEFSFKGKISNDKYDYSVSGNLFAIVMDCMIDKGEVHNQVRFLAPDVHMNSTGGEATLPVTGSLY
jgi:hypothetical protein